MLQSLALSVRPELMIEMLSDQILVVVAFIVMEFDDLSALVIIVNLIELVMGN